MVRKLCKLVEIFNSGYINTIENSTGQKGQDMSHGNNIENDVTDVQVIENYFENVFTKSR